MYWGKFVASSLVFSLLSKAAAVAQLSLMSITASYVVCVCVCGRFYWSTSDSCWQEAPQLHPHTHTHGWARARKRTYAHYTQQHNKTVKLAEELFFSAETASEVFAQRPDWSVAHWRNSLLWVQGDHWLALKSHQPWNDCTLCTTHNTHTKLTIGWVR